MISPTLCPTQTEGAQVRKNVRGELGPFLLLCVCYLVVGIKFFVFIHRYSVNLFFWDHWDLENGPLFEHHSLWEIFRWQHGPHRQGFGGLVSALIDPLFHWSSRAQSFEAGILVLLASFSALWLKRRLWGRIEYFDAAIPFLFLTRTQAQSFAAGANISHGPMPVLLVVLYCLAWTFHDPRWKYSLVVILNFLLIYTGFGIFMGIVTPLLLLVQLFRGAEPGNPQRMQTLLALIAAAASLVSFFSGYVFAPAVDCFSARPQNPIPYLWFVVLMFANFAGVKGMTLLSTAVGGALALATVAAFVFAMKLLLAPSKDRQSEDRRRYLVIAGILGYALLFCLNTAIGRICLGTDAGQASRYIPYLILSFFGLYLSILTIRRSQMRKLMISIILLFGVWCGLNLSYIDWLKARNRVHDQRAWRECYLQHESVKQCDTITGSPIYPWPEATHLQEKLQFLKQKHLNLYSDQR